jgi:hypothetical protein
MKMSYVKMAHDAPRNTTSVDRRKLGFTATFSLIAAIRAKSSDGEIRSSLVQDLITEGWIRWQEGAALPFKSKGGGLQKIQVWVDREVMELVRDAFRASNSLGLSRSMSAAARRLILLGLEV